MIGLLPRKVAWDILMSVSRGSFADEALRNQLKSHSLSALDRGFVTELAYGSIRQRYLLDCWINSFARLKAIKQPPKLRWLLHISLYQLLKMDKVPSSAVVNTSVELIKKGDLSRLAPFVNGFLRSVIRAKDDGYELQIPIEPASRISQIESIPIWLAEDLIRWKGEVEAGKIAQLFNHTPKLDLRINRLYSSPEKVKKILEESSIESNFIQNHDYGLEVVAGHGEISHWPGYKEGLWCVQDRSSQFIAPLLEPHPGEIILDACSAPGGKTTHIAELIGNEGVVWAIDRSAKRLKQVSDNANRLGCTCVQFLQGDASQLLEIKPEWKGYFQRVLLDAPCSGLGTLARNPDARWRITQKQIDELVDIQANLLEGLIPLISSGGRIVYSTCTMHPLENSKQIYRFLQAHNNIKLLHQNQVWPNSIESGDGFYSAVMEIN